MTREKNKFIIAGAGGIGKAVGLILADKPGLDSEIYIGDLDKNHAANVAQWIIDGCSTVCHVESFEIHPSLLTDEMDYIFQTGDIILDCLPGTEAPRMAAFALKFGMHYVNLTEYVQETEEIIQMVSNSDKGFVLQSGLAPGYVNILAHKLYLDFCERYKVNVVDHIKMRVGALTATLLCVHLEPNWRCYGIHQRGQGNSRWTFNEAAGLIRDQPKNNKRHTLRRRFYLRWCSRSSGVFSGESQEFGLQDLALPGALQLGSRTNSIQ